MNENEEVTGHLSDQPPIDYFDGEMDSTEVSGSTIERLTTLAISSALLAEEITKASVALAELEEKQKSITRVLIPNIMEELGLKLFKLTDGSTVEVNAKVNASISEANRPAAFTWLEEKGYDGIIKTKVNAEFGKGEIEEAYKAQKALQSAGFLASVDRSVHPATLTSFVKERLAEGDAFPPCFGIFEFKEAKIKALKVSKPKKK